MPDSSSRSWWSRSKPATRISLNSIASAIGLKSKKHRSSPSIQDPPTLPSTSTLDRPSPARSRVDSTGPSTPVDGRSLPTLSHSDPFAGRQNVPPVPQTPSKKTPFEDSMSCASSLSSSANQACDASALSPATGLIESWKLPNKPSISFSRYPGCTDISPSPSPSLSSKRPGSSPTAVADAQTHSRPKLRARGMTDSGSTKKSGYFLDECSPSKTLSQKSSASTFSTAMSSTERTSPRAVIRHASLNRLIAPPCAPPAHSLPETPTNASSPMIARTASSSPSCISFASSSSNEKFPALCYPFQEKRYSERSVFPQDYYPGVLSTPTKESKTTPSSPRKLKKPLSQQSLSGKSNVQPPTPTKPPPDKMIDKVFRKQKTLHHTRSPIPSISNPVSLPSPINSTTFPSLLDLGSKTPSESGNRSLSRKKIRSHSSITGRPSTSHSTEDDSLSVYSLRSDPSFHLKSAKAALESSFWDEPGSPVTSSSRSTSEYTPQPILSAAQVAKLEASIENSPDRSSTSRPFPLRVTTALDEENLDFTPAGLSPPPTPKRSKPGSLGSATSRTPARARSPPRSPPSNGNPDNDSTSTIRFQPFASASPAELATSLPPPPRSQQRSLLVSYPDHPEPSFSPSVSNSSRSKSSIAKNMHRRSIMKKPSFLEIADDTDQDDDLFSGEAMTDSFLDLAGESCNDP